jgi:hypothetical protein
VLYEGCAAISYRAIFSRTAQLEAVGEQNRQINQEGVEMKLKTVFTVNYILAFCFGTGFIFFPTFFLSLIGINVAGDAPLVARGLGVFVFGTSILTFFTRDAPKSEARRAIVLSLFGVQILAFIYNLSWVLLFGIPFNLMIALLLVIHAGLAAAYGFFLFGAPREIDS